MIADVRPKKGFFNFETPKGSDQNMWTDLSGSWSTVGANKSSYFFGSVGRHFFVGPNTIVGGLLEFDVFEQSDEVSSAKGDGWLLGPYFVTRLSNKKLYVEGRLLYGKSSNEISYPNGTVENFDTKRLLSQFKVSGALEYGDVTLEPNVLISYSLDQRVPYSDVFGDIVSEKGVETTQAEIGVNFSKFVPTTKSNISLEIHGGLGIVGSAISGLESESSVAAIFEQRRGKLELGANLRLGKKIKIRANTFYEGVLADDFRSYGLQLGFDYRF
jgi:outer membrane autotransporter protein